MPDAREEAPRQGSSAPGGKPLGATLTALVGAIAAGILFAQTPAEESGRTVEVVAEPDGSIAARHVSGPLYLAVYRDVVGVPTACDGITGKGITPGKRFTEAQCMVMLEAALVEAGRHVLACAPTLGEPGRDQQRAAAVLLTHNIGWPAFCRSTVARLFNARDWRGGCQAFRMWNRAGGRVLRGLAARREREIIICMKGLT
jgi:lysozyme